MFQGRGLGLPQMEPERPIAEPDHDLDLPTERLHVPLDRRELGVGTPFEAGDLGLRHV